MIVLAMSEQFIERRKYRRVKSAVDILITILRAEGENEYAVVTGKAVNISGNGLLLAFDEEIPADTSIKLTFFLPDSDALIEVKGKVARIEKTDDDYNIAVEYTELKKEIVAKLDEFLNAE
jgi:c-di-GMP-binding flagellar brake protein YcgR